MEGIFILLVVAAIVFAVVKAAGKQREMQGRPPRKRPGPFRVRWEPHEYAASRASPPRGWEEFAAGMGLAFRDGEEPAISGTIDGRFVRIDVARLGAISTRLQTSIASPLPARLVALPAGRNLGDPSRVETGDPEFDAEYGVACRYAEEARRTLGDLARRWLLALGDAEALISGTVVSVRLPGVEAEPDRLRGLVELSLELARGAESRS